MKTLLFITHSFPSINSANSFCVEKLLSQKPSRVNAVVLCYRFRNQKEYEEIHGVKVYRISKDWFWPIERDARDLQTKNRFNDLLTRLVTRARQLLYLPAYPLYDDAARHRLKKAGLKIAKKEGIDTVFADFNGCDTLMAGYDISNKDHLDFVPLFWDYLFDGFPAKYVTRHYNDRKKEKLETKILSSCKKAVFLDTAEKRIRERYASKPELSCKLTFIGIPFLSQTHSDWKPQDSETFTFIFGGSMGPRHIEPILSALSKVELPIAFKVYSNSFNDQAITSLKKKYPFLEFDKPIPFDAFVQRCCESDFLVNLGVDNPNVLASKIFLYFSTCKPVISTYPIPDEPCKKYVEEYPLGYAFNEENPDLSSLKSFLTENKGKKADAGVVRDLFHTNDPSFFWTKMLQ